MEENHSYGHCVPILITKFGFLWGTKFGILIFDDVLAVIVLDVHSMRPTSRRDTSTGVSHPQQDFYAASGCFHDIYLYLGAIDKNHAFPMQGSLRVKDIATRADDQPGVRYPIPWALPLFYYHILRV